MIGQAKSHRDNGQCGVRIPRSRKDRTATNIKALTIENLERGINDTLRRMVRQTSCPSMMEAIGKPFFPCVAGFEKPTIRPDAPKAEAPKLFSD